MHPIPCDLAPTLSTLSVYSSKSTGSFFTHSLNLYQIFPKTFPNSLFCQQFSQFNSPPKTSSLFFHQLIVIAFSPGQCPMAPPELQAKLTALTASRAKEWDFYGMLSKRISPWSRPLLRFIHGVLHRYIPPHFFLI